MYEFRPPAVVQADSELTLALRAGDEVAVRELFDRYGPLVFTIAHQLLSTDAAEGPDAHTSELAAGDVTLHTFLQAWRNSEVFEPGRSFGPWLATIARRASLGRLGTDDPGSYPDNASELIDSLQADPSAWHQPPAGLDERVVAAVVSEAHLDPADIYTASDLITAQAAASQRGAGIRPLILGAVGALIFLLLGIVVLSSLGGSTSVDTTTIQLRPTGRVVDAVGSIDVEQRDSGLAITLDAPSLVEQSTDTNYVAWVVLDDGSVVPAGSFRAGSDVNLFAAVASSAGDQFVIAFGSPRVPDGTSGFDDADVILRARLP